jgi:hypothetical protein
MKNFLHGMLGVLLIAIVIPWLHATTTAADQAAHARVRQAYDQHPLSFEANQGQADPQVKFLSRGQGYHLFLTTTEAVLTLRETSTDERGQRDAHPGRQASQMGIQPQETRHPQRDTVLRIKRVGANPQPQVVGSGQLPGTINYAKGSDPQQWVAQVPTYTRVTYVEVYPGVDLVYYGNQGQLEYDFHVAVGADPHQIILAFEGADTVEVDRHGDLVLHTVAGALRQRKPFIYQEIGGVRREVSGGYVLKGPHHIGFQLASYDTARPLVIDPLLLYSTYLGGNGDDTAVGVAMDAEDNLYVAGTTASLNFPTTPRAHQRALHGDLDVFVTKFDATGSLVYSTYLGDCAEDTAGNIAVDAAGNAYVTGRANSGLCLDFPRPGAFVAKLNPAGRLAPGGYFLLFGGRYDASSKGHAIAVDTQGRAYVAGVTLESDFPTTPHTLRRAPCPGGESFVPRDGFVAKVNAAGTRLLYSTYLCGSGDDSPNDIAVDPDGHAYVAGYTTSSNFPTRPFQLPPTIDSGYTSNGFVTKLRPDGAALVYSTYLGGSDDDGVMGIAVHAASRHAYVTGFTSSRDFPTTPGVVQPKNPKLCAGFGSACVEAFVTRLNAAGARVYSTYLFGEDGDQGNDIAVDAAGNAYVTGETYSRYFPIVKAFQPQKGTTLGTLDAFVAKLNATGSALLYSSYLGGNRSAQPEPLEGEDVGVGIAVDTGGNAVVVGVTNAFDFPTLDAWQPHLNGGRCGYLEYLCYDIFVTKVAANGPGVLPAARLNVRPRTLRVGGTLTATWAGIPTPRRSDRLRLVQLGTSSHDTLVPDWPITGAGSGSLQLRLPRTLRPGMYELRLITDVRSELTDLARSSPFRVTP